MQYVHGKQRDGHIDEYHLVMKQEIASIQYQQVLSLFSQCSFCVIKTCKLQSCVLPNFIHFQTCIQTKINDMIK